MRTGTRLPAGSRLSEIGHERRRPAVLPGLLQKSASGGDPRRTPPAGLPTTRLRFHLLLAAIDLVGAGILFGWLLSSDLPEGHRSSSACAISGREADSRPEPTLPIPAAAAPDPVPSREESGWEAESHPPHEDAWDDADEIALTLEAARLEGETCSNATILYLAGARDPDGAIGTFFSERILMGNERVLRHLPLFLEVNPSQAERLHRELLDLFDETNLPVFLTGIAPALLSEAHLARIEQVALDSWLAESRAAAYDLIGRSPRGRSDRLLPLLESAFKQESEEPLRQVALYALLRLGGVEAIPALERSEREDDPLHGTIQQYIALMRHRPDISFDDLLLADAGGFPAGGTPAATGDPR